MSFHFRCSFSPGLLPSHNLHRSRPLPHVRSPRTHPAQHARGAERAWFRGEADTVHFGAVQATLVADTRGTGRPSSSLSQKAHFRLSEARFRSRAVFTECSTGRPAAILGRLGMSWA